MKIAVCVKAVPEAAARPRIDPQSMHLDRSGEPTLNPFDVYAVEEGLRQRDAAGGGEVVVVSMGPERAAEALRRALALGADRAVLVSDGALAGSDLLATSRVLARALDREQPDLVLLGQQGEESVGAVLGAALAERLRMPCVSQAAELTIAGGMATVERQTEYGYDTIGASLPAVIAVSDAINEPRYPSLKGIMAAKSKPLERLALAELDVAPSDVGEAGSRTTVRALGEPPKRADARIVEDGDGAQAILDYLVERSLV